MTLNVSRIQHFSVGDGEGIRTTIFLKGCNLRCPWCHNPETWLGTPQTLYYEALGKSEVCGTQMELEAILQEVLTDRDFYEESGGGVTISGGEAMLQADGVAALAGLLRAEGIPVLIDTAGNVPYDAFEKVVPWVNGFLYDYKSCREEQYSKVIGGSLSLVRENLSRLRMEGSNVRVRIPLIPGFNVDPQSITLIGEDLCSMGVREVDLLPFHRMGSGKYKALGWEYVYSQVEPLTEKQILDIRMLYEKYVVTNLE